MIARATLPPGDIARGTRGDVGRGDCVCLRGDVMRACA